MDKKDVILVMTAGKPILGQFQKVDPKDIVAGCEAGKPTLSQVKADDKDKLED